jgi:triacylglycerol lipase
MLAWMLRGAQLALVVAAGLLGAWLWSRGERAGAVAAGLAVLAAHAWVMALEFALMAWRNRRDPAPRARWHEVLRAWWAEVVTFVVVFGWRQPWREHAVADAPQGRGRRGVVFIHGYVSNRGLWTPWFGRLRALGVPYASVSLAPVFESIDRYAPQVEAAVQRIEQATGLAPVLVCHSMGGLVARAWLRWQGTAAPRRDRVHRVVTIGSPHHGTWLARWSGTASGRQMRMGSAWLQDLARSEDTALGARFICIYGHCDNIVFPASTAVLPGARAIHVRACPHVRLALREEAFAAVLALLAAPVPAAGPAEPAGLSQEA